MNEPVDPDSYAELLLLAHLRRLAVGEILSAIPPADAAHAVSASVQRLVQYLDEGPVQSIARVVSDEQFKIAIDQVISELQSAALQPKVTSRGGRSA